MPSQNKSAELEASGAVLERIDQQVWNQHLPFKSKNLKKAGVDQLSGCTILDFGCGPGTFGVVLGKNNHVVGIDIAKQAVQQGLKRGKAFGSDFQPIVGDGERLCVRAGVFDICFSGWALHHLPSVPKILEEFYSLLKPGGKVVIIEPNESAFIVKFSRFIEDRFRNLVLSAGLDTANRTTHTFSDYDQALRTCGFEVQKRFSYYNGELPELPRDIPIAKRSALKALIVFRHFLFKLFASTFGQGSEIFFVARKPRVISSLPLE